MLNSDDLLKLVKKAAVDAVDASKPSDISFGKVISASPLKIMLDQRLTLTAPMLILSRNVTEFKTDMTINGQKKTVTVHNALHSGDEVLMIRKPGGQSYIVIDRIGKV